MPNINLKIRQQRIAPINAERYVTVPVRYSNISTDDLINYASQASGISKAQMSAAFYAIAQQVEFFILNGHGLTLGNLGNLYLSMEADATTTEDAAGAEAVRRIVVRFRQSNKLRDLLKTNVTMSTLKLNGTTTNSSSSSDTGSSSDAGSDSGSSSDSDSGSGSDSDSGSDDPYNPFGG